MAVKRKKKRIRPKRKRTTEEDQAQEHLLEIQATRRMQKMVWSLGGFWNGHRPPLKRKVKAKVRPKRKHIRPKRKVVTQ